MDWGTLVGKFSSLSLPALGSSLLWNSSQLYTSGVLSVVDSNYLSGDFNRDGHVNAADISAMFLAMSDLQKFRTETGLTDPQRAARVRQGLALVREKLGGPGASRRAALAILQVAGAANTRA